MPDLAITNHLLSATYFFNLQSHVVELGWRESIIYTKTICWMPNHSRIQIVIMLISTEFIQWSSFFSNTPLFWAFARVVSCNWNPFSAWPCLSKFYPSFKNSYRESIFQEVNPSHTNSLLYFCFDLMSVSSPAFMQ